MNNPIVNSMLNSDFTENGCPTLATSNDPCIDLFFSIASMRGASDDDLAVAFTKALIWNPSVAMKILFWARDIRGGAGERRVFRTIVKHVANRHPGILTSKLISLFPVFGRWDDLLVLLDTNKSEDALDVIERGLKEEKMLEV